MKKIIDTSASRGYADYGWLKTHHTFSFADYQNPERMQFGALRVLNDDILAPGEGFGTHPHKNMEVVSIPLKGNLRHGDSLKNSHVISRGQIQVMSTGTGIYHSEFNDSSRQNLEFLQIWVTPKTLNTKPKYEDHDLKPNFVKNEFSTFISPDGDISLLQDVWFSWAEMDKDLKLEYTFKGEDTGVYVFVVEGGITIDGTKLSRRDGMGITETRAFEIKADEKAEVLLIEVTMKE